MDASKESYALAIIIVHQMQGVLVVVTSQMALDGRCAGEAHGMAVSGELASTDGAW